jgi:hypothetical protein
VQPGNAPDGMAWFGPPAAAEKATTQPGLN